MYQLGAIPALPLDHRDLPAPPPPPPPPSLASPSPLVSTSAASSPKLKHSPLIRPFPPSSSPATAPISRPPTRRPRPRLTLDIPPPRLNPQIEAVDPQSLPPSFYPPPPRHVPLASAASATSAAYYTIRGARRVANEDRVLILEGLDALHPRTRSGPLALYGVFDGHGGALAAQLATELLEEAVRRLIAREWGPGGGGLGGCAGLLRRAFEEVDRQLCADPRLRSAICGTTATVALLAREGEAAAPVFYLGHVGDSRAVAVSGRERAKGLALTTDHVPGARAERARIARAGGVVLNGRVNAMLGVSRALGDAPLKKWVLGTPQVARFERRDLRALVLGTDGLWDALDLPSAVRVCATAAPKDASARLGQLAVEKGSGDDVTVLVVGADAWPR